MMVGERLVALNATNGTLDTAFGTGGFVDIGVNWGGVPLVFKNIVVVGSNNGEVTLGNDPGDTKAYDARTGAKLWTFVSVAQPVLPTPATQSAFSPTIFLSRGRMQRPCRWRQR